MLVPNWRAVALRAWSVRFIALICLVQGLDVAMPLVGLALPLPDGWLPWVTLVVAIAAAVSRFIPQKAVSGGADE
ncbi:DUF7940 domain-containing protein [Kaistia sp. MMO-174]|uniref:DUF7940 domain-containing protein n=1 Tax=Kaistia sp. MMO-174 TaxID=3081256 RepID=UPI003018BA1B